MKDYGVAVAMPQGQSWPPHPTNGTTVNVGTTSLPPPRTRRPGGSVGKARRPLMARGGAEAGSSPRAGKPSTWRSGPADHVVEELQGTKTLVNTGELWPDPDAAWLRVRRMQTKLHRWAVDDPGRGSMTSQSRPSSRFPRGRVGKGEGQQGGARTAGVDRVIPAFIADGVDIVAFLGTRGSS